MHEANDAVDRKPLHFRQIAMSGWQRSDGLYEVEGRVTDRKPDDFTSPGGTKRVPAGEPIHDMGVRLVFDQDMVVHEVTTFTLASPYGDCTEGGRALQAMVGVRIAGGWSKEVRARLGGARSCTHLMELLIPMGTAAYQSLASLRIGQPDKLDAQGRPVKVDSCYAYGSARGVVMRRWPAFYTGPL